MTFNFLGGFSENSLISISWGSFRFSMDYTDTRTEGQVKMMKLIVAYSNFSIALARDEYPCCQVFCSLPSQHSR